MYSSLAEKVSIRNTGSTIGNLSYVLTQTAAAVGSVCMRPEEIGSLYALIKGAGGSVCNHQGKDLGNETFSPDKTYPIVAGNPQVVTFILNKLKRVSK